MLKLQNKALLQVMKTRQEELRKLQNKTLLEVMKKTQGATQKKMEALCAEVRAEVDECHDYLEEMVVLLNDAMLKARFTVVGMDADNPG